MQKQYISECIGDFYGQSCQTACSTHCKQRVGRSCDKVTGNCINGCDYNGAVTPGLNWSGPTCDTLTCECCMCYYRCDLTSLLIAFKHSSEYHLLI